MQHYDVAIVGAGLVGLTLAAALEQSGLDVVIIDSASPKVDLTDSPELQVSAINLASQRIFENLNVWQNMQQHRVRAYTHMHVWEQDSFADIRFNHQDVMQDRLGSIIENNVIKQALLEKIAQAEKISIHPPCGIDKLVQGSSETFIALQDGEHVTAKLVVGADGANSYVRKQANFAMTFWDYDHIAIVATVECQEPHQNVARQAFTADGPLAFLPLYQDNLCSIVWSQKVDKAESLLAMNESDFNRALGVALDNRLGLVKIVSQRISFPLKMRYCRQWAAQRVMLIGDAAHTIHPLAGQGANLGIADAAALAQTLIQAHQQQKDIGDVKQLRALERWRKAEAMKMIAVMEGFKRLFNGDDPVKKLLRDVGMSLTNQLPPLKHRIIRQAMGLDGKLPELAKHNIATGQ